jgi:selenocysteine-specific elongation factor
MHVVATAGHVDHGKSTLVRALTGMEPDRWEQERRRGLTIDLGYVWTALPGLGDVAFVDVPGHRRFIGNMLAGLGPAPAVLLVVAADEGWREQSSEHLAAIDALGLTHGLLVVTRSDLADPGPALAEARDRIRESSLGDVVGVAVSAVTSEGLPELRAALSTLCRQLPEPRHDGRVRLWVDRSFTVRGSGTVVTGTLGAGTIRDGDTLVVGDREVTVRGLQSLGRDERSVTATARVALNLRGVRPDEVPRGSVLLTPDTWPLTAQLDVRLDQPAQGVPQHLTCHVGTAAVPVRLRPLGGEAARLLLDRPLPLEAGDRVILRDPSGSDGSGTIAGAAVVDVDPPALRRRGAAAARAASLLAGAATVTLADEVRRRGLLAVDAARLLGHDPENLPGAGDLRRVGDWLVTQEVWRDWTDALERAVTSYARTHPLDPLMPQTHAVDAAGLPDLAVLRTVADAAGLTCSDGRVHAPGTVPDLGAARPALDRIVARLTESPFDAPEQHDLQAAGLGPRELAAAEALGLVLRLADGVVLLPISPARAMRILAGLPQPFTTSEARQALGTTRRVAIPLLEHLDSRGWTRRVDAGHREVVGGR